MRQRSQALIEEVEERVARQQTHRESPPLLNTEAVRDRAQVRSRGGIKKVGERETHTVRPSISLGVREHEDVGLCLFGVATVALRLTEIRYIVRQLKVSVVGRGESIKDNWWGRGGLFMPPRRTGIGHIERSFLLRPNQYQIVNKTTVLDTVIHGIDTSTLSLICYIVTNIDVEFMLVNRARVSATALHASESSLRDSLVFFQWIVGRMWMYPVTPIVNFLLNQQRMFSDNKMEDQEYIE